MKFAARQMQSCNLLYGAFCANIANAGSRRTLCRHSSSTQHGLASNFSNRKIIGATQVNTPMASPLLRRICRTEPRSTPTTNARAGVSIQFSSFSTSKSFSFSASPVARTDGNELNKAAALCQLRDLLDANPGAASEIAEKLGPSVCQSVGASLEEYLEANKNETGVSAPPFHKLKGVFLTSAVPFVGFGIIDNAIMLVAGDQIDMTLGVSLGISTLAAAGLGNLLSDVGGVWAGGAIERAADRMGLPAPVLSRAEENHQRTKSTENLGSAFGVAIGCLIGMLPLLLIDAKKAQKLKREDELTKLFEGVFDQVHELLEAERATLLLLDDKRTHLWSRVSTRDGAHVVHIPLNDSIAGSVIKSGKSLIIPDVQKHPSHYGAIDRKTDFTTRNMIASPIMDANNDCIGVVEVINSKRAEGFTRGDESLINAFSGHIGITVAGITASDDDHREGLKEALQMIKNQQKYLADVDALM